MQCSKALFLDKASMYPDDLDFSLLDDVASWQWFNNINFDDLQHCIGGAEIIVTNKVLMNKALINKASSLKLICVAATGINNIDLDAAKRRGIKVCNVRAYATHSVTQHIFSLILLLNQKLLPYRKSVINGEWSHSDFFCYFGLPINGLEGKTLGIVGYGELGKAVAKLAKCFSMEVLVAQSHDTSVTQASQEKRVDLKTLLAESDVVSLHCPLTESNHNLIAKDELLLMKADAILINAARGGLVDELALLDALKNGVIGAAALDVLDQEPPAEDNPLINYQADNLIITPHIAWASRQSRQKLVNEIAENIRAYQQGIPRNIVV